jgi:hypothetical protein
MATIVLLGIHLLGIHWSAFFTKDSFMNMPSLLLSSIGRISLTMSAASPLGQKYNLPLIYWCWTEFLSLYSLIIFTLLWNYLSNLTGYPYPTCATMCCRTISRSWEGIHVQCDEVVRIRCALWFPSGEGSLGATPSLAREVHGMKILWFGHKSCSFNGEHNTQDTPPRDLVTKYLLPSWMFFLFSDSVG